MSEVMGTTEEANEEASFVIFADGSDGVNQMDQGDESQQLSIGDDGITIVVTPENEHQVSELLRALQASQGGEDVQILTETSDGQVEAIPTFAKIKEETTGDEADISPDILEQPKRKRGRPPKASLGVIPGSSAMETANKKAKLIELALQEADASVAEDVASLRSSRLREKAAKQGGLKKLWLSNKEGEEETEEQDENVERLDLKSDGESDAHKCEECPEVLIA